jgi:hypothetical protein
MIVKNEQHIIAQTLEKLLSKIKIDYWVISDTGSTDNTKSIIRDFFKTKNICGELYEDEWVDFAHNRTKALEYAFNKTDYVLIFDADDEIKGELILPDHMDADGYYFKFGNEYGIRYIRISLVNNRKKWIYKSVLHEYIVNCEPVGNKPTLNGNYYVISGRTGFRSQQPDKYIQDATILEKAYEKALKEKDDLYKRYAFYCANSYKDAGKLEDAIKWYKITLGHDNWVQEKYMCCLNLYNCYDKIGQKETGIYYLVESIKYDRERAECLTELIAHYCQKGMSNVSYNYYVHIQCFFENQYFQSTDCINNKLFVQSIDYELKLPYYMIIVSYRIKQFAIGVRMYEIIFSKKYKSMSEFYIGNLLYNLKYFIEEGMKNPTFISDFQSYFDFLIKIDYPLVKHDSIKQYEKYGLNLRDIFLIKQKENLR